jgi:hypothetical protein
VNIDHTVNGCDRKCKRLLKVLFPGSMVIRSNRRKHVMIVALFRTLLRATDLLLSPEPGECETPGELPISALAASKPDTPTTYRKLR